MIYYIIAAIYYIVFVIAAYAAVYESSPKHQGASLLCAVFWPLFLPGVLMYNIVKALDR